MAWSLSCDSEAAKALGGRPAWPIAAPPPSWSRACSSLGLQRVAPLADRSLLDALGSPSFAQLYLRADARSVACFKRSASGDRSCSFFASNTAREAVEAWGDWFPYIPGD